MKLKIFTFILACFFLVVCSQKTTTSTEDAVKEPFIVTFEASTIDGETITSDCFADSKLTMLNVWATYCNPCLREMPDLGEIAVSYDSSDFQMLGAISDISVFSEADAIAAAVELIEKTGATTYPHLLLNESLYQNLIGGVDSVPTTFFINKQGELLGYVVGSRSKETWKGLIDELLAEMD